MLHGKFITLEGGEGVGKTTNLTFIKTYLEAHDISVVVTREPGGTPLAENLRQLLLDPASEAISEHAELLMIFAARAQHLKHVIEPALARGDWVLSDRFTDATYAYQGGGRNMRASTITALENLVQGTLRPDLTLLLDAPIEMRRAYLLQAELFPERIKIIKANQALVDVQNEIISSLSTFLR